jgi:hypothetical protein
MRDQDGNLVELEKVTEERDLGVTVDNRLTFSSHVKSHHQ